MGCSNQKLHSQQIAYQRDFLGACWNTSLGDEEAEEYLASRWMGVSKNVMALYTNNHCFTVRTLNKDEKARTDAAAAGKPATKPSDDPTGVKPGFGGNLGGGGGGPQTPSQSPTLNDSPSMSFLGKTPGSLSYTNSSYAPFPEARQGRDSASPASLQPKTPPPQPAILNKPAPPPFTTTTTMTAAHTTVRQSTAHAHSFNNNSVASVGNDAYEDGPANSPSMLNRPPLPPAPEKARKGSDPAALRNVVKDSLESERVVHADHPYLQRHGLSVYGGVVFRCAPAHRLYHRISLVPEASMKRLYDMQVTAMSRSVIGDPAASSMIGPPGGASTTENYNTRNEAYHHFQFAASSSDCPQPPHSGGREAEERGVPPITPQVPPSNPPSMVPSPMSRPLGRPPGNLITPSIAMECNENNINNSNRKNNNVTLLGSSLDQAPLPSLPLGAVPARHLRFASGPGAQQSAVIDAWAAESPLSTFNNYPAEDRDVAGVVATRPPVIIGSVTAMELQALPPNAEVCFGGWLVVSLQDEQERLRRSLTRYAARQRRRAAKAAAADPARFSSASSSAPRGRYGAKGRRAGRTGGPSDFKSTSGIDETDVEVEDSVANGNTTASVNRTTSFTTSPPPMPAFSTNDGASPSSESMSTQKRPGNNKNSKGSGGDGGEEETPASGPLMSVASRTIAYKDTTSSPLPRAVDDDHHDGGGEPQPESNSSDADDALAHTSAFVKTPSMNLASAEGDDKAAMAVPVDVSAQASKAEKEESGPSGGEAVKDNAEAASLASPTPLPLRERMHVEPLDAAIGLKASRSATVAPQRTPSRTPSRLRPRSSSVPPSPMMGPTTNLNPTAIPTTPPPLRHTGRYAREAMEADALNATWLPYAYIVVAVPMYECSLVPTTFHTAFTRHKAVSLNLGNAQSRQAYGVGCITGVRYGGVMVIEYRDKINDEEDAEWIAELIRAGKAAQRGSDVGNSNANGDRDKEEEEDELPHFDLSASALFRHLHHSPAHRARAEKLRRIKSRIWHKLRRQGLHVVLAATRMADRRHRQQRASIASEVNNLFSSSYVDAAAAVMGASHTPQHFATHVRRTTSAMPNLPSSTAAAQRESANNNHNRQQRSPNRNNFNSLAASRIGRDEPVRSENAGVEEGGVGADYAGGGAEELNEALEDAVDDFDSTNSSINSSDTDSDGSGSSSSSGATSASNVNGNRARSGISDSNANGIGHGGAGRNGDSLSAGKRKKGGGQWWRAASSQRRHRRRHDSFNSENELSIAAGGGGGKGNLHLHHRHGHHHHHHHHRKHRHGVTTREDRLRWTDPQMADDFYLRGTFRQIGGMRYLDVVSLMDGCPVSELVQGIKRWVVNLLSMPIKARPICLFLQRYEGIAASLRIMQTQLTATALASNVASGKQLAQGNFSFHIPSAGLPGADGNAGLDEVAASFASQHVGDPIMDPVASPSALVNASFAALQAPVPAPTRTLAYHTYYCGPLEPEVRAVLSPEVEAMIASCQNRQLPEVLRPPGSRTPPPASVSSAAAAAGGNGAAGRSTSNTADPLSPPARELASSRRSTLVSTVTAGSTLAGRGSTAKALSTPEAASATPPSAAKSATTAAAAAAATTTAAAAAHKSLSTHSGGPLSPNLGTSPPLFNMPHSVDVSSQLSQKHASPGGTLPSGGGGGGGAPPAVVSLSLPPSVIPLDGAPTHPHAQTVQPTRTPNSVSPRGSFGAPSTAAAKTTGGIDVDAAGHVLKAPPANTVPKTITEMLLYDDPTKHESTIGNSFTAANGQALAAAAAALVLAENVKGPAAAAATTNASLAATSTANNGSFATAHGANEDSLMMVDGVRGVGGGSFDHPKGWKDPATAAMHNNNSFISLSDNAPSGVAAEAATKDDKKASASPTIRPANSPSNAVSANGSAATSLKAADAQANATKDQKEAPAQNGNGSAREDSSDASTGTFSRREKGTADASQRRSSTPPPQLLPAARACNRSDTASNDSDEKDSASSGSDDDFNDDEAEERELEWQLADRELRALKSELDEMIHLASTARGELLERLEELIQLGAVFLPHTRPDQVGLCLITMKMLRQYPEEVPVKEIHTDWVPLLMTLLTSSREHLFCTAGYDGGDLGRMVGGAQGFLRTYNNIVDACDMCDANKRREACDAGITKYMIDPLPPMPAPRRLHDIVIAPQPVRFTRAMLQDIKRVGMDSEGLSFSFSGGSLGVLAGVLYYYSDFLRAKYRSEVAAVGGRAKDAGATVLDVLSRGGYNVLLRRIWIWGVTPESKKSTGQSAAAMTKKLLHKRLAIGDDSTSGNGNSTPPTPPLMEERDHIMTNTASVGGNFARVVGRPFRGTEAYALYDAIAHYLRTLEELCTEHHGNSSLAPQAPVKRRSVLMAWRRSKDNEPTSGPGAGGVNNTSNIGGGGGANNGVGGDGQNGGADGFFDPAAAARDLVPAFEVCVATNYYYKRMMDEAHWPARSRTGGGGGLPRHPSTGRVQNGDATRHSSTADVRGKAGAADSMQQQQQQSTWRPRLPFFSEKTTHASPTTAMPAAGGAHQHDAGGSGAGSSGGGSHDESRMLEQPYCGGEEAVKKDAQQRKATKKFYSFLADHYEQWRARHNEDRATNAYGKRIVVSMN